MAEIKADPDGGDQETARVAKTIPGDTGWKVLHQMLTRQDSAREPSRTGYIVIVVKPSHSGWSPLLVST